MQLKQVRMRRIAALCAGATLLVAACGSDDATKSTNPVSTSTTTAETVPLSSEPAITTVDTEPGGADGVLKVPDDFDTIQGAVDAAKPGDLILIAPGTYHEAVNIETDELTLRGLDRNTVVLDGNFELDNGVRVLGANGVSVENMTATNYTSNGFFWTGVTGYRGSYLTAYRTGDYGVYAFDSTKGQLNDIYAAGSPDAGVYIGECFPCDAVIQRIVSEHNGLGYSGTNSGGNLLIVDSVFRFNRAGIVPNSGSYELCYPSRSTTIIGNVVYSNNQGDTAAIDVALLAMGNGILSAGAVQADIERNLVFDHDRTGIGLVPFPEDDPNDDLPTPDEWTKTCEESKNEPVTDPGGSIFWESQQNTVKGNVLEDNREADLVVATLADASVLGNCFSGNTFTTTAPTDLETLAPCDGTGSGDWTAGAYNIGTWLTDQHPPSADWKTNPLPDLQPQENMPDAATAPANPATNVPPTIDLDAIQVPAKPTT